MGGLELGGPDPRSTPSSDEWPILATAPRARTPGHRCFATRRRATAGASRQVAYGLNTGFSACARFRAWESLAECGGQHGTGARVG